MRSFVLNLSMFVLAGIVMILCSMLCKADEQPVPDPISTPEIVFPMDPTPIPPVPTPQPSPSPTPIDPQVITTIKPDEWYVVQSSVELIIREFEAGIILIDETTGPRDVRGKFSDGNGKVENRTYTGKFLYFITAGKPGKVAVDFIPDGITKATQSKIIRQVLTVDGTDPNPPPKPDPPGPDPVPTAKYVRLSVITDSDNLSPDAAILLNALVGWNELQDSGSEYRLYDIATTEEAGKKAIEQLNGAVPGIVITNKDTGAMLHHGPLPATFSELKTLVGGITGG